MGHRDIVTLCEYDRYSLGLALEEDTGEGCVGTWGVEGPEQGGHGDPCSPVGRLDPELVQP